MIDDETIPDEPIDGWNDQGRPVILTVRSVKKAAVYVLKFPDGTEKVIDAVAGRRIRELAL